MLAAIDRRANPDFRCFPPMCHRTISPESEFLYPRDSLHDKPPMLTVISPAKTLDFDTPAHTSKNSMPLFPERTEALVDIMRNKTSKDLIKLMRISQRLAELNVDHYRNFKPDSSRKKQAVLAFRGDVYIGLDATGYTERDFNFAQKHLRVLSGLYGLLRPLDLIQPYRLEMGIKLKTPQGKSLYEFWGEDITNRVASELKAQKNRTLVNLASKEYFKAVHPSLLPGRLITPVFKDYNNGTYKVFGFFAKKARGSMASYIVKNRIDRPGDIKSFDVDGYRYNESFSGGDTWVFTRRAD